MKIMTYTESRARYAEVLDQVVSLMETVYLMQSPANARHLRESIAQLRHGNLEEHDLIDIPDEEN